MVFAHTITLQADGLNCAHDDGQEASLSARPSPRSTKLAVHELIGSIQLKAPCVELIQVVANLPRNPDAKRELVQSLAKLLKVLREVAARPDSLDGKLAEFVFVPISHVLRVSQTVPIHALELCLECISILLRMGWGRELSGELFGQLLILFTFLANPSSAQSGISATSEELQAAGFKCIAELITETSRTSEGRQLLTRTSNVPTLGNAVLVMVDSLAEASSNDVRLQALAAIQALSSSIDDLDALASFLPRMVSSLTKALTPSSSTRANFRLLERSLDTLSLLILRLLSDHETKNLPAQAQETFKGGVKVLRTASWLQATAGQIKLALANILKLRKHDKKEVRHALLQLCLRVIQDCRASLSDCTSMMIEALITLAGYGGDQDTVEGDIRILLSTDSKLAELLRESLHGWVISIPRLMESKDDTARHQIIQQIAITLRLLNGEQTDLTIIDDLLATNLRDGVSCLLGDSRGIEAVVESTIKATEAALVVNESRSVSFNPLRLQLKGQNDIMNEFKTLLQELAKSNSALTVAHDLVNTIGSGSQETRLATFWLSVKLVEEVVQFNAITDDFLDIGTSSIHTELLDELYAVSLAKLTAPDTELESHWHFQALSLEVISLQAMRYKTDFRVELIDALYPVLHCLGTPNSALRNHAMTCLNIIADVCGYGSARDLVTSNVDYIINTVGLKLNYHDISPQAPQVLLMMMRLCGPSLLPHLDDLVDSIFSALERYHGYPKLVELLFSVLKGMAEEGIKAPQLSITADGDNAHLDKGWKPTSISEVVEAIRKLKTEATKQDDEHASINESFPQRPWKDTLEQPDGGDDEQQEENQDGAVQSTEPPRPAPKTFDILLKISELTQHYLTSSSPALRTSLLSLLNTTIPALAKHENSFLPLVNTLWPVLLRRLDDPEAYVVANAFDIMAVMCEYAGNFMKGRIEGMWEDLKAMHRRSSKMNDVRSGYRSLNTTELLLPQSRVGNSGKSTTGSDIDHYRPEKYVDAPTRMTRESLNNLLMSIAQHVAIREDYFDDIVDILDPVLEHDNVRKALENRNPDAVWLRLLKKRLLKGNVQSTEKSIWNGSVPRGAPQWKFVQVQI